MLKNSFAYQKEIKIRFVKLKDIDQLLPLLEQLGYPQVKNEFNKWLKLFVKQSNYGVVIAEIKNKIVGCVAWTHSYVFVSSMSRLRIECLIVDKEHRRKNIGKLLMLYVENFSKRYKPCMIDLTSGQRRKKDGTHEFYKALGYSNEGYRKQVYLKKML